MYRNIALEGSGVLQIAYLGALRVLEEKNLLANIDHFVGSSGGAMVAGFLACKMPLDKIQTMFLELELKQFKDSDLCCIRNIRRVFRRFGYYKGDALCKWYGKFLSELPNCQADITFSQVLNRFGNYLVMTGTSVDQQKVVYFNPDTHPDMPIRLAARISASIPLFFQSIRFDGQWWIDGGVLDNYPVHYFDEGNLPEQANPETLGLKILTGSEVRNDPAQPVTGIKTYLENLHMSVYNQSLKYHVREKDWCRTVKINVGNINALDFNIEQEQRHWLVSQGKAAMEQFLESNQSIKVEE